MAIVTFDTGVKQIRGKSGNITFAQTKFGIEYKSNPIRTQPPSAAQLAQQARVKRAAAAFKQLTAPQNLAWQTYAQSRLVKTKSGAHVAPSAYAAFTGLYTKFVQVNPSGTPPTVPPASEFAGDNVVVTVTANDGTITFTANKANATSVTTELLLQPLKNVFRKPTANYASKGFFTFATGTLSKTLTVTPGAYAVAIRFVSTATGQEVDKVLLGTVNTA